MKFNICILCLAIIYTGFCLAAAEEPIIVAPPAQIERPRSPVFHAPEIENIVFLQKQAKIVICTEKQEWGNRIKKYLEDDPALINQIEQALNVRIIGPINYVEDWMKIDFPFREYIIITYGNAVKEVLDCPLFYNSIILLDPEIPETSSVFGGPILMHYKDYYGNQEPSNRVYNFYSLYWPKRPWRKIYPAAGLPGQLDGQYYFQGINIFTQIIDEKGKISERFNFETMDKESFGMILATIAKTNKYRLQPDLKAIIRNYSTEAIRSKALYPLRKIDADLPIVAINKPLVLKEKPLSLESEIVHHTGFGAFFGPPDKYYRWPITPELAEQLKPIMENEKALSSYTMQMHANESKAEEELRKYKIVQDNPYMPGKMRNQNETIDMVSTDIKVYRLEHDYIEKRKPIIKRALQQLCPGATRTVNIAIMASGGGSRAMFATYGALKGLNDLGILEATSYICGLSGSTWAISSFYIQANKGDGKTVTEALAAASRGAAEQAINFSFIQEALLKVPTHTFSYYPTVLKVKSLFNQPITNTDWYGNGIAKKLLGEGGDVDENFYVPNYLSQQLGKSAQWVKKDFILPDNYNPKLPFPIYTAISPLYNTPAQLFPWFEFTPYQIGAVLGTGKLKIGMFVKTWAFGREFEGGHSMNFAPEQALDFYLGIFGSAMNCTWNEALARAPLGTKPLGAKPSSEESETLVSCVPEPGYFNKDYRSRYAEVFNPAYRMTDAKLADYSANKTIGLIDAGLAFNLPFPPLNDYKERRPERKPDVVIMIDASADATDVNDVDTTGEKIKQAWPNGDALWLVEQYARANDVPFPKLLRKSPWVNLASATCSIFNDPFEIEEHWPLVIYLPVTKDTTEISNQATFNGVNLINKVKHDNIVSELKPTDLAAIELGDYATQHTGLSTQEAINLMALMQYNVLINREKIKQAICNRAIAAAPAH